MILGFASRSEGKEGCEGGKENSYQQQYALSPPSTMIAALLSHDA
jgi:hypothetical protein